MITLQKKTQLAKKELKTPSQDDDHDIKKNVPSCSYIISSLSSLQVVWCAGSCSDFACIACGIAWLNHLTAVFNVHLCLVVSDHRAGLHYMRRHRHGHCLRCIFTHLVTAHTPQLSEQIMMINPRTRPTLYSYYRIVKTLLFKSHRLSRKPPTPEKQDQQNQHDKHYRQDQQHIIKKDSQPSTRPSRHQDQQKRKTLPPHEKDQHFEQDHLYSVLFSFSCCLDRPLHPQGSSVSRYQPITRHYHRRYAGYC